MNLDEGPECDFCNITLDEDEEELQPIYVGEQPKPKPHRLQQFERKASSNRLHVYGKPASMFIALYKALEHDPNIEVEMSDRVYEPSGEVFALGEEDVKAGIRGDVSFEENVNKDKVGVSIWIEPNEIDANPDVMVCEDCADMFRSLSKDL